MSKIELREFRLRIRLFGRRVDIPAGHLFLVRYDNQGRVVAELHGLATERPDPLVPDRTVVMAVGSPSESILIHEITIANRDQYRLREGGILRGIDTTRSVNGITYLFEDREQDATRVFEGSEQEVAARWNAMLAAGKAVNARNLPYNGLGGNFDEPGPDGRPIPAGNSNGAIATLLRAMGETSVPNKARAPGTDNPLLSPEALRAIQRDYGLVPKCFAAGTLIDMADGSFKPIERIEPGDWVMSYDATADGGRGALRPGRVSRAFVNRAKHILDVHGLRVTPGHITLCGDGPLAGHHLPIIDIIRLDGALVDRDGNLVRAATNCRVDSLGDRFVWAITGPGNEDGFVTVREKGRIRLGTRVMLSDGMDISVLEIIEARGLAVTDDGLLRTNVESPGSPYHWTHSDHLPEPQDYILRRSGIALSDIYSEDEWEDALPSMTGRSIGAQVGETTAASAQLWASEDAASASRLPAPNSVTIHSNRAQRRAAKSKARLSARATYRGEPMH